MQQLKPNSQHSALDLLETFLAGRGANYRRAMSNPIAGAEACSRLSVPLSTGAISIREALNRCYESRNLDTAIPQTAIASLISRLHWHCHFIQKLESEPQMEHRAIHPAHERARHHTPDDDPILIAWAQGRTGYPFVDACMRSLIATGWLNFRMRAMMASVAYHHLGLDWRATGLHLARLFTDYEPGIHWPQIQMQSGQTGINTPRIYNPVKQGLDQDPTGAFTRRWVPELAHLPLATLQTPWLAEADYPAPLADPIHALAQARTRLSDIRAEPGYRAMSETVYLRHGSRTRKLGDDHPIREHAIRAEKATRAKRQLALEF